MANIELIVAGDLCLDITPEFNHEHTFEQVFSPGRLSLVGKATIATGGAVANTGLAAHLLGLDTVLMGKIGTDLFGGIIKEHLLSYGVKLALKTSLEVDSSYTFVLNLAGKDRFFIHHSGANDYYYESDIDKTLVQSTKIFHFGYPPLMKSIYQNQATELLKIYKNVKRFGLTTSLDMAMPDLSTESGQVDWEAVIKSVAPYVDIFLPSYEELFLMLDRDEYLVWRDSGVKQELSETVDFTRVREFGRRLQNYGMGIIMIKAGKNGIYLRTPAAERLKSLAGLSLGPEWANKEFWAESVKPEFIASSTGAGDCAIAGFLTALIRGYKPSEAIQLATFAGYQNLKAIDAVSGLGCWENLLSCLNNEEINYNELDLAGLGFKREKKGLWSTDL